ncbi:MAG: DUF3048 domain-containing protein [Firmicutes bacterium]|nr:DUF3048 domain-containing protein [Bacillota bacterium]
MARIKKSKYLNNRKNLTVLIILLTLIFTVIIGIIMIHNKRTDEENFATFPEDILDNQDNKVDDTGANDEDEKEINSFIIPVEGKRPYAVMIDNEGVKCLPQGGLDQAQIIYEIIVEGGETRFMPLFWETEPELIGPVRSSRHYFLDYVLEHDAIYVHFGWSPMAMRDIPKLKINNINGVANGGEIFWDLTEDKNNWQDSYTSMEKIKEYVDRVKYRTTTEKKLVFTYNTEDTELEEGVSAEKVGIKYNQFNTSEYIYDTTTKQYSRFRKGEPHMERVSGEQLKAKNIIIQFAKNYTIPGDKEDRQEVETVGSGEGWFITCGKAIKIKWSKNSREEATKYTDEKGNPIMLNPGQTWIQIISPYAKVDIQ